MKLAHIWLTIWCKNFSSASFWAPTRICTLPVVLIRWTKPICRKRLWAQDLSILKFSFSRRAYRFSKAFAVAIGTKEDNSSFIFNRLEINLNKWVDFVTQKTRASSQLIYDDFLGRFLFAMRIFDLSLVTLSKSTNCTLIQVWVSFFPFSGRWRRAINTCVFSDQEGVFIRVSLVGATWLFQYLMYRCINSFMVNNSQS